MDGTLVDIEPLFFKIFNTLAKEFGYTPLLQKDIPALKKLSLKELIWKHLNWRLFLLPWILKRGQEEYHALASGVTLFSGIPALLTTLRNNGYHIGIVSSSRSDTIHAIIARHHLVVDFIYHGKLFNKADSLKKALLKEHLSLDETLYVGDEIRDIKACQKIGMDIIAVTYGLNDKSSLQATGKETADTVTELLAKLLSLR